MSQLSNLFDYQNTKLVHQKIPQLTGKSNELSLLWANIWRWFLLARQNQQLKQQNWQLIQEIRERQQAEQAMKLFLHTISHDLRNPLVGMSIALQSFLAQQQSSVTVERKHLEVMWDSCKRQQQLLDYLVEMQFLESHWQGGERKSVSLAQLIEELLLHWQPIIESHQAAIAYNIGQDLPLVWINRDQIWRVFDNLIGNAIKHNPVGVAITVEVVYKSGNNEIRCTVTDNGVGIAVECLSYLFDAYTQGKTFSGETGKGLSLGWGLGLYICRRIVEAYGGRIGVESQVEQGTQFWFTLPIVREILTQDAKL